MSGSPAADAAPPRPAATVVLLRPSPDGPEVLLTRRPATMAFGPGLHVFPGGALDPSDADPVLLDRLRMAPDPAAGAAATHGGPFVVAAIRELYEEAGVLVATRPDGGPAVPPAPVPQRAFADLVRDADLVLRGDWLAPLSRWVTPPGESRRYDTRFFVACLPEGAAVALDDREVAGHAWMTPRDALAAMAVGRIALWPPTSTTLQQLAPADGIDDVRRHLAPQVPAAGPVVERLSPLVARVRLGAAGGIGGQTVCAYLLGHRRLVLVDPGDPNDEAAEAILAHVEASGARVAGILLTAPVPDHAAGAEGLSIRLGAPIHAAAGAGRLLASDVVAIGGGETLDLADVAIRVHATPGTHPDHLAFEVRDADAVVVGDLEGPGPSRAIPEPVDAVALARSRARLAALAVSRRLAAHD